jgi:hypothetical protein
MKLNLKSIVVCFIAAPLATIALFAGAGSAGLEPNANREPVDQFQDRDSQGRGQRDRGHPLLDLMDIDQNGVLSSAEIQAMPETLLAFDSNGDGALDGTELQEAMPPPPPRPPRGGRGDGMGPPREGRSDMGPGGFPFRGE